MKETSLRKKLILSFFSIILVFGISVFVLGFHLIKSNIIERAQKQVKNHLNFARSIYNNEIEEMKKSFKIISISENPENIKKALGLDYFKVIENKDFKEIKSEIVLETLKGKDFGGTRLITKNELLELNPKLYTKSEIKINYTPKARPTNKDIVENTIAIEYALPIKSSKGYVYKIIYGGKILNRNFDLIDKIHNFVFENKLYDSKPIGTVTIFQDDVRIATNVLNESRKRAIGTRVSAKVYENVVEKGNSWIDRAFVVTDWYLAAYEPIKDIKGNIIGILYVGLLEKPFTVLTRNTLLVFLIIIVLSFFLSVIIALFLAQAISKPVTQMIKTADKISDGYLLHKVKKNSSVSELNKLAKSINNMSEKLAERDKRLRISNEKLANLNKSYLDLISFVSHELKGILSSTILNAYTVRDGFLGMINFKQRKSLDSITRNLDYLASTVKNFFDLSRIEKGEMNINKKDTLLKEDVFDRSVEAFFKSASEKGINITNNVERNLAIKVDLDLLQIVSNNLVGNAIKYGMNNGNVILKSQKENGKLIIEIYNDGDPIKSEQKNKLFKKFSRADSINAKKVHGTGLGLFITKEIVEKHGGEIWFESKKSGNSFIFTLPYSMET